MISGLFRTLTICVSLALTGNALIAQAEDIKGEDIRNLIAGKTIFGYNVDDREDVTWYFATDGVVKQRKKGAVSEGTWRIEDDIGRLCIQLRDPYSNTKAKERCRVLAKQDDKLEMHGLKKDGRRSGETLKIKEIVEGNADNM
jgi:hypothetical protein